MINAIVTDVVVTLSLVGNETNIFEIIIIIVTDGKSPVCSG